MCFCVSVIRVITHFVVYIGMQAWLVLVVLTALNYTTGSLRLNLFVAN